MRSLLARVGFVGLLLVYAALCVYWYPQLPEYVASHFDGAGVADGWQSREGFLAVFTAAGIGSFLLVGLGAPLIKRTPRHLINLPNKDYWLAPERIESTLDLLTTRLLEFSNISLALLIGLFHQLCASNAAGTPGLPGWFGWGFAAYMLYVLVWTVWLMLAYRRP